MYDYKQDAILHSFWISADEGGTRTLQFLTYDEARSQAEDGYSVAIKVSRKCGRCGRAEEFYFKEIFK